MRLAHITFIGYRNNRSPPPHTDPYIRLRYDADGHISSLGYLCITEQQNFRLPSHPAAAALVPRAIPTERATLGTSEVTYYLHL